MLTPEFFEQQKNAIDEYRAKGYLPLDEVLEELGTTIEQLIKLDLLQPKPVQSTTDVYDVEVTEKGRGDLKELKRMQLVLVERDKVEKLRVVL